MVNNIYACIYNYIYIYICIYIYIYIYIYRERDSYFSKCCKSRNIHCQKYMRKTAFAAFNKFDIRMFTKQMLQLYAACTAFNKLLCMIFMKHMLQKFTSSTTLLINGYMTLYYFYTFLQNQSIDLLNWSV